MDDYFELKLDRTKPIEAKLIAQSILGLSRRYKSFIYQTPKLQSQFEDTLYLKGVKEGSDIFQFVPIAIVDALPLISDTNTVLQFLSHMKQMMEYFKGQESAPQKINTKICDDVMNIVEPTMIDSKGMQFNVNGNMTVNNHYHITPLEAQKIHSSATKEKHLLQIPDIEIKKNQTLKFIQSRTGAAKTDGINSPDKGIIQSIDSREHSILFDEEIEGYKWNIIFGEANIFTSEFIVDIEIIKLHDKIKAYKILHIREK